MKRSSGPETARRVLLPVLQKLNPGDIRITHHWTGSRVTLHSFKHKGYWYYGAGRERGTMLMCAKLLSPGDRVVEVGGHIGYLTEFFAEMVGPSGQVDVLEPTPESLKYLRRNTSARSNVKVLPIAASDSKGTAKFFVESLTGQNNSLVQDYSVFEANAGRAGVAAETSEIEVQTDTLDNLYLHENRVDLLKIDVEGAELQVLRGARQVLKHHRPVVMIEVSENPDEVQELLEGLGYRLVDDKGHPAIGLGGNVNYFALHPARHSAVLGLTGKG